MYQQWERCSYKLEEGEFPTQKCRRLRWERAGALCLLRGRGEHGDVGLEQWGWAWLQHAPTHANKGLGAQMMNNNENSCIPSESFRENVGDFSLFK